jgi:hypothetical protein
VTSDDVADLPVGETVFGEPRMVGDPRITTAQAGVILKMTRQLVWNLIGRGDLPAYGPRNSARRLKLSDVQRLAVLGEPICVGEAARILHCPNGDVRAFIRAARLRLTAAAPPADLPGSAALPRPRRLRPVALPADPRRRQLHP